KGIPVEIGVAEEAHLAAPPRESRGGVPLATGCGEAQRTVEEHERLARFRRPGTAHVDEEEAERGPCDGSRHHRRETAPSEALEAEIRRGSEQGRCEDHQ